MAKVLPFARPFPVHLIPPCQFVIDAVEASIPTCAQCGNRMMLAFDYYPRATEWAPAGWSSVCHFCREKGAKF